MLSTSATSDNNGKAVKLHRLPEELSELHCSDAAAILSRLQASFRCFLDDCD